MSPCTALRSLSEFLHRANAAFCAGLLAVTFVGQIAIVVLRYAFGVGFLQLQDLVGYSFAMLVVLSVPVALRLDSHVRVDILRGRQDDRARLRVDLVATLFFLMPVFAMTLWLVMPQILYSWSIRESGMETGGLPGFFLVKTALPLACALILVQALSAVLDRGHGQPDPESPHGR